MALEKTFEELGTQLSRAKDAFQEVRLTVVEDRPLKDEVVIVERFEYRVEDILGWMEDAGKHVTEAQQGVGHPLDLDRARRGLSSCQELYQRIQQRYSSDLISYRRLDELTSFGRQRRGEWQGWTESVKKGLEQCRQPLDKFGECLTQCWQELAERLGTINVSVQATSIGQQITKAVPESKETVHEGII